VLVERYSAARNAEWNAFVASARNGVFLFDRGYMEYHAERFTDHSLLFLEEGRIVALLPASERDGGLVSHGGLTFGGVLTGRRMTTSTMLAVFGALRVHLAEQGLSGVRYKAVPHIYHDVPAEEDLYALFINNARLVRRDVSSTILLADRVLVTKGRKSSVGAARKQGLVVARSHDFEGFMVVEEAHLAKRYGVKPVHSGAELAMLASRFPDAIKLFVAMRGAEIMGGIVVYESRQVAHAQYIASTDDGKLAGALDLVMDHLLNIEYPGKRYFDFGISTEQEGRVLNTGLVSYKESYGARATLYDVYELDAA
jgi:Acetyltransferase (GNAT) domain